MKQSRGFTLIEVLTVVGIIAILAAMLFLGARTMSNTGKKNATRTMLLNLKSMVGEREAAVGATAVHNDMDAYFTTAGAAASQANTIGDVDREFPNNRYPYPNSYAASGLLSGENAVGVTQYVIVYLSSVPANKTVVANLPPKQFLESPTSGTLNPPVFQDGYGYPIIAVPSAGLTNVSINGVSQTIRSPDGKPFFASPGPDGDFSKGDDNVYSFEN